MRGMLVLALVFLAASSVFGSAEVTVAAVTRSAGVPAAAGLVLALWAVGSMLSGLVYGAIRWRSRSDRRFLAAVVLLAVLTAPKLLPIGVPLLAVVFLLAGIAIAPVLATGAILIEGLVPASRLTEGLAWTGTAISLTYALSAALAGALIDGIGPHAGFLVPVASAVLAAVVAVLGAGRLRPAVARPDARPVEA
jgi:MFS family permease